MEITSSMECHRHINRGFLLGVCDFGLTHPAVASGLFPGPVQDSGLLTFETLCALPTVKSSFCNIVLPINF